MKFIKKCTFTNYWVFSFFFLRIAIVRSKSPQVPEVLWYFFQLVQKSQMIRSGGFTKCDAVWNEKDYNSTTSHSKHEKKWAVFLTSVIKIIRNGIFFFKKLSFFFLFLRITTVWIKSKQKIETLSWKIVEVNLM